MIPNAPTRRALWPFLAGILCLSACAALLSKPVTAPPDWRVTKVSHSLHAENDVECGDCHDAVYEAEDLEAELRPDEEVCEDCHMEKEDGDCGFCHIDAEHPRTYPERERVLNFSHVKHIERVEEDCTKCHVKLPEPEMKGPTRLTPTMDACRGCHNHDEDFKSARCEPCHKDLTKYGERPISLFSHEGDWLREHSWSAKTSGDACASTCHDPTFCSDCHARTVATRIELKLPEAVDRDFIHRDDFASRHMIEARLDPALCNRCHGRSFCKDCHLAIAMTPGATDPLDPHGEGWYDADSGGFHGEAARMDITSCAACHEDGPTSICVECHRVGGIGGTPHMRSMGSRATERRTNPMCLYCHAE